MVRSKKCFGVSWWSHCLWTLPTNLFIMYLIMLSSTLVFHGRIIVLLEKIVFSLLFEWFFFDFFPFSSLFSYFSPLFFLPALNFFPPALHFLPHQWYLAFNSPPPPGGGNSEQYTPLQVSIVLYSNIYKTKLHRSCGCIQQEIENTAASGNRVKPWQWTASWQTHWNNVQETKINVYLSI